MPGEMEEAHNDNDDSLLSFVPDWSAVGNNDGDHNDDEKTKEEINDGTSTTTTTTPGGDEDGSAIFNTTNSSTSSSSDVDIINDATAVSMEVASLSLLAKKNENGNDGHRSITTTCDGSGVEIMISADDSTRMTTTTTGDSNNYSLDTPNQIIDVIKEEEDKGKVNKNDNTNNNDEDEDEAAWAGRNFAGDDNNNDDDDDDVHEEKEEDYSTPNCYYSTANNILNNTSKGNNNHEQGGTTTYTSSSSSSSADAFGDIWSTEAFSTATSSNNNNNSSSMSPLHDLLDTGNYSLLDLLAQDELLQELRGCEPRLMAYFCGTGSGSSSTTGADEVAAALFECLLIDTPLDKAHWCAEERDRRRDVMTSSSAKKKEKRMEQEQEEVEVDDPLLLSSSPPNVGLHLSSLPTTATTTNKNTNICSPERKATVLDISSPSRTDDELCIEASWNSPPSTTMTKILVAQEEEEEEELLPPPSHSPAPGAWMGNAIIGDNEFMTYNDIDEDEYGNNTTTNYNRTPEEEYDMRYIRYPYMACEILCSDVILYENNALLNSLVNGYVIDDDDDVVVEMGGTDDIDIVQRKRQKRRVLDLSFGVLLDTEPLRLDDRRAGYLERVLNVLFTKRGLVMCDYMNTGLIVTEKSGTSSRNFSNRALEVTTTDDDSCTGGGNGQDLSSPLSAMTEVLEERGERDYDEGNVIVTESQKTSYIDLLPGCRSYDIEDDRIVAQSTTTPHEKGNINDVPPILMCAFFDHMHSHSIMHIIQRLLLPSPKRRQVVAITTSKRTDDVVGGGDDNDENPNSEINNRFMTNLSAINHPSNNILASSGSKNPISTNEIDDEDEEEEEDPANHIFQCDWSTRMTDHVLELLLKRLGGNTSSFLIEYGYPVGYEIISCKAPANTNTDDPKYREDDEDVTLSYSQHASEILITIIQNSPLDSPFMVSLSSDPILHRIIDLIMSPPPLSSSSEEIGPEFVSHESIMTCGITVLESLVLQLGGYGAVAAISGSNNSTQVGKKKSYTTTEYDMALHDDVSSPTVTSTEISANTSTLLRHMTALLARLSELLIHPLTQTWVELAQYSNGQKRNLLGASRLRILRLIESLVLLGNHDVDLALLDSDCLEKCLDLFWQFEWCSMLHQSVANMLVHVFEGGISRCGLQEYFLIRCNLVEKLMASFVGVEDDHILIVPSSSEDESTISIGKERQEGENEIVDQFVKDIDIGSPIALQYDKMIRDMKSLDDYDTVGVEEDVDAVTPVSEDDVDSAMEHEEANTFIDMSPEVMEDDLDKVNPPAEFVTDNSSTSTPHGRHIQQTCFRKGYMGHAIIICQALVHACNNSVSKDSNELMENDKNGHNASEELDGLTSIVESSQNNFNADHHYNELSVLSSKKRKDRSPVRDGADTIKRFASSSTTISDDDLSSLQSLLKPDVSVGIVSNGIGLATPNEVPYVLSKESPSIDTILRHHPQYDKWSIFVSTTLAFELSVQSTPLGGGQHNPTNSNVRNDPSSGISAINPSIIHSNNFSNGDFLDIDEDGPSPFPTSGLYNGLVVGEIDMDENDLDLAATMMEALRVGHNRHRPNFGGGDEGCSSGSLVLDSDTIGVSSSTSSSPSSSSESANRGGIANFGSVIHQPSGFEDYVYDDPLGHLRTFENGDSIDDEVNGTSNDDDDDGFMSVSRDGVVTRQHCSSSSSSNGRIKHTRSSGSSDDDDDDDDVPVLDLYTGTFDTNFANFDAFDDVISNSNGGTDLFNSADDHRSTQTVDSFIFSTTPVDLVDSLSE